MSVLSRTSLGCLLLAWMAQGCASSDAPEAPPPRWSGDPTEERARAARDAADTASEIDEDELAQVSRAAGAVRSISPAATCDDDPLGSFDYCSSTCLCEAGEGDCDDDGDCDPGLACMRDTGALFGFDPEVDVCMERCSAAALGTPDFCSSECPCEAGQGDCDRNSDCAGDNVCAKNVGASFGFSPDVDVCVDACDPVLNGTFDYCSPACPCEHAQGDCDRDSDCAPGHVCVHNVGADYGFEENMDMCVAVQAPQESFAGRVIDGRGGPVVGATVTINQVPFVTGDDGSFALTVEANAADRYVINVEKSGYMPRSRVHVGAGMNDLDMVLTRTEIIAIDPSQPVDVEDQSGTRLALPPNALVDENGEPPHGPITVQMHTYDLLEEEMVGNMEAVDENGQTTMLESIGAVSIDFVGANGRNYQLAPGQTAQIAVELPPGVEYSGSIPLWHYDMEQGRWIEEGVGVVLDGVAMASVSHFSVWNFDVKRDDPACIQVIVPDGLIPPGGSIEARVVVPPPFPGNRTVVLDSGNNVLFNLPPNVDVQIFVPVDAATPMVVNTGAPWGGRGVPPEPYAVCNGEVTLPGVLPGQLVGFALLQGRTVHAGITVRVLDDTGALVTSAVTSSVGQYQLSVDSGTYDIEIVRPGYLPVRIASVVVHGGKVRYLPCVQLSGGDVNEDGRIDTLDVNAVLDAIGSSASPDDLHDINGDGVVDTRDLLIVQGNQGKEGPIDSNSTASHCPSAGTRKVVAGGTHSCALQEGGTVRCWGRNTEGQLGYGHSSNIGDNESLIFAGPVDVGETVRDLVAGFFHTCALLDTGTVRCWGENSNGRLGYGHLNNIGDNETPASAGDVDIGGPVVQLVAGGYHTCALLDTGTVRCWGENFAGELGYAHTNLIGDNETPAIAGDVNVGGTAVQLAANFQRTCALLDTGAVRCWGANGHGQLGYGHTTTIGDNEAPSTAGTVDVGGTVVQLDAGFYHTCAVLDTGAVRCWGANYSGQLGYGHTTTIGDNEAPSTAGDVNVGGTVARIDVGGDHACALLDTGAIRCWGENFSGQLGYGHTSVIGDDEVPSTAGNVDVGGIVEQLTGCAYHTCAFLSTGGTRCWGWNDEGQLGYGHTSYIGDNETPASAGDVPFL